MVICMGGRWPNPKERGTSTVTVPVTLSCVIPSGAEGANGAFSYSKSGPAYFRYRPSSYTRPNTCCSRSYTFPVVTFFVQDEPESW